MRTLFHSLSSQALKLTLPATAFLVPLFFLPITSDFFTASKQILLVGLAVLATLAWATQTVLRRQIRLSAGPALVPLLLLVGIYILSALFQSPNLIQAARGQVSTIAALTLIYLATTSTLQVSANINRTFNALFLALIIAGAIHLMAYLGVLQLLPVYWLEAPLFNPAGGPLPLLTFIIPVLPGAVIFGLRGSGFQRLLALTAALIAVIAGILALAQIMPSGQSPLIKLPFGAGWLIALENLKSLRTALLGTGPETFANSFNILKPAYLNQGQFWSLRFTRSSNELLMIFSTVGIFGLLTYVWALGRTWLRHFGTKELDSLESGAIAWGLGLSLLLQLWVPANLVLLSLTFVFLALATIDLKSARQVKDVVLSLFAAEVVSVEKQELPEQSATPRGTEVLPWFWLALAIAIAALALALHAPAYGASLLDYQSMRADSEGRTQEAYQLQVRAVQLNPYDATMRVNYSRGNFYLASSLASRSEQLSDQEQAAISELVQLAVSEAKAATNLDPYNSVVWENLGNIYRELISLDEKAVEWAVAGYTRAIQLDPANPSLRLRLAGLYYALGNYDQAIVLGQQAATLKPDLANAHYNLAVAFRDKGELQAAAASMQQTLNLLDPQSDDYAQVESQLAQIMAQLDVAGQQTDEAPVDQTGVLDEPVSLPDSGLEGIQLPDNAGLNLEPTNDTPVDDPNAAAGF
jgi:tetratricopeptide (TPR) repeat protein